MEQQKKILLTCKASSFWYFILSIEIEWFNLTHVFISNDLNNFKSKRLRKLANRKSFQISKQKLFLKFRLSEKHKRFLKILLMLLTFVSRLSLVNIGKCLWVFLILTCSVFTSFSIYLSLLFKIIFNKWFVKRLRKFLYTFQKVWT